jgi:hypothetical protein
VDEICGACGMDERDEYNILTIKPQGKKPLGNRINGRILKWILKKWSLRMWIIYSSSLFCDQGMNLRVP